ncbi:hypothetical protein XENOCAPTIV_001504 [Xenoophorus captivus]|uniref:Uncharacterized protein n=1 Tax=Xenoophorus captivus TaxID=1517983 RepID=A0ABV0RDG0_9TELE
MWRLSAALTLSLRFLNSMPLFFLFGCALKHTTMPEVRTNISLPAFLLGKTLQKNIRSDSCSAPFQIVSFQPRSESKAAENLQLNQFRFYHQALWTGDPMKPKYIDISRLK